MIQCLHFYVIYYLFIADCFESKRARARVFPPSPLVALFNTCLFSNTVTACHSTLLDHLYNQPSMYKASYRIANCRSLPRASRTRVPYVIKAVLSPQTFHYHPLLYDHLIITLICTVALSLSRYS